MYYEHVRYGVPARDGIREEDEANARLIAAAPELLHACKLIATWFKREKDGPNYEGLTRDTHPRGEEIWGEWWNRNLDLREETQVAAFAAIAKAEASRTEGRTEGVRS